GHPDHCPHCRNGVVQSGPYSSECAVGCAVPFDARTRELTGIPAEPSHGTRSWKLAGKLESAHCKDLRRQNLELQAQLARCDAAILAFQNERLATEGELRRAAKERDEAVKDLADLELLRQEAVSEGDEARAKLAECDEERREAEATADTLSAEVGLLKARVTAAERGQAVARGEVAAAARERDAARAELETALKAGPLRYAVHIGRSSGPTVAAFVYADHAEEWAKKNYPGQAEVAALLDADKGASNG
ncbi:MAG: hypothetical protein WC876_01660, partial [Candidatus Thermoplasmatota archaeon]